MASFNKVILIGRLTADPELKQTTTGISVCNFSIAVDRRFARADQGQQTTDFINIVAWRQSAEFVCRFFKKGNQILVCGQLQIRSWTDPQGGKRSSAEVVADELSFVDSKSSGAPAAHGNETTAYTPDAYGAPAYNSGVASNFEEVSGDDGLPF